MLTLAAAITVNGQLAGYHVIYSDAEANAFEIERWGRAIHKHLGVPIANLWLRFMGKPELDEQAPGNLEIEMCLVPGQHPGPSIRTSVSIVRRPVSNLPIWRPTA